MKEKLIIFDYDGVIVDSLTSMLDIFKDICNEIKHKNFLKEKDLQESDSMVFEDVIKDINVPKEKREFFIGKIRQLLRERGKHLNLFPEIGDIMRKLNKKNYTAIISNNYKEVVYTLLKINNLEKSIDLIIGAESQNTKSEKINIVVTKFNIKKENVFFVGDTVSDIRESKKSNIKSIAVLWGYQKLNKLETENPTFIAKDPRALLEILQT